MNVEVTAPLSPITRSTPDMVSVYGVVLKHWVANAASGLVPEAAVSGAATSPVEKSIWRARLGCMAAAPTPVTAAMSSA